MRPWFSRLVILWALILATVWVGEPYVRSWLFAAKEPRTITPRGELAEFERVSTAVFHDRAPAVALILSVTETQGFFGARSGAGTGSGFIWDAAGHIVTNYHVVEGATQIRVRFEADRAITAEVVGTAPDYDLAVLRPVEPLGTIEPLPLGASKDLTVGQTVFAIGNPFGLSRSMSEGIISALDRRLPASTGREIRGVIQTDAAINPGNSGGPLLDTAGRLIGVNTAILSQSGSFAGVGFAVPVDVVNEIVPKLIEFGHAPRPGIGIQALDETLAAGIDAPGVIVADVAPGSPADLAGLEGLDRERGQLGDVITHVGDTRVRTVNELAEALVKVGIGNTATLTVARGDVERKVQVEIIDIG